MSEPPRPSPTLPTYDELPLGHLGGRLGWHVFGADDQVGLINLLTPERRVRAARLVHQGTAFPLDAPLGFFDPPLNPARGLPRHHVIDQPGGIGLDDVWDNVFPQAGSQWDSLAHIGYGREVYYNGATAEQIRRDGRNGIHHWASRGIAGRAVVLDIPRAFASRGLAYDPGSTVELGPADLEQAREHAGVDLEVGDILLVRTGFTGWYAALDRAQRRALPRSLRAPGLAHTEDVCRYLWDAHVCAVATDTFAVEAWPADTSAEAAPFGFIHQMLIGSFGMALGELWWLDDLAADCARTGVYEGLLVSAPTYAPGGISATPNAVLLK
jgi:kynurenine formamidase